MEAARKDATLELLIDVVTETAPVHTPDGWDCTACAVPCGASIESLCKCCLDALELTVRERAAQT